MKSAAAPWARDRRARSFQRRMAWTGIVTILALLISLFPQVAGLPVPTAEAHNLNASVVYVFFDPDTQAMLDARIAGGWVPGTPLLQDASSPLGPDELGIIIKIVPDEGTTTGVGGYTTFYVPDGLQVLDAAFLLPGSNPADGITDWDKVPAKGQARMPAVGAGGEPTVSLVGITRGPNILGVTSPIVTAANTNLGTLPGVYGDSGIFYSVEPETAFNSYYPTDPAPLMASLKNNSGDAVGFRTILKEPLNAWDAWQMAAFGIAGTTNPSYPGSPIVDSNGRGYAPWGLANVVAGPQSGYAWGFDKSIYDACDPPPVTTDPVVRKNCIDQATQAVGPWQRIKYDGSLFADDPPGNNPAVQPYVSGTDASWSGYALSPANPLPATTGQGNGTPNAVRWAFGQLTQNRPEYAWIKVRINDYAQVLDNTGCPKWTVDTFGGDAGGDSGGKDHIWRYYDPNSVTFDGCLAVGKPATRELVKVGEYFQYKVKLYNAGNNNFSTVQVKDTLPSGATFISAVPAPSTVSLPYLTWNVSPFKMGQMFEATVTVQAKSGGLITNSVCAVGTTDPGGQTISSCANDTTLVGNLPLLDQGKTVTPTAVAPGGQVTYTVRIRNIGTGATGSPVAITELLPAGFTYVGPLVNATVNGANVTATTTVNAADPNRPVFTVPGAINAGSELLLSFKAQVSASLAPGSYCNAYTSSQNGINLTTGSLACVQVAGGKIGDTVWRDWDGDGAQDPGEEGIAGVTVKLYASDGTTLLQTTTTDANGNYFFPGLVAGTYVVEVNNGAALPGTTQTGDPDSACPSAGCNNRHTVTLSTDQQYLTADFGYKPTGAGVIGDKVFEDVGNDGVFDGADAGIPNVTVWLYEDSNNDGVIDAGDALVATTASNASGDYSFTGLATGYNYLVKVDQSDPDIQAYFNTQYDPDPVPYQLSTAEMTSSPNLTGSDLDNDFGFWKTAPGEIGDQVFIDNNGNGVYDAGDTPLAGITVTLYRDGEPFRTTVSGSDGAYLFDNLGPGSYTVEVDTADPDLPAGLFATVTQYEKTLAAGESYLTADFPFVSGLTKTASKTYAGTGETVQFTLKPFYPGTALLENVRVFDPLPTGTTYVSGSANAGGTYGAYSPLAAVPGQDIDGGPSGGVTLDTAMSVSTNFVNTGGSVNVTLNVKSSVAVSNVSPTDLVVDGGSATCTGPTPASANVPSGTTGSNFVWACTLTSAGEYIFTAAAEDATASYTWPEASSASVLSAATGGPNVVTWNLGSNQAGVPGETLTSGYAAGIYAFGGANKKWFSKYSITNNAWADKADPTNGIEKGGSLTTDGVGTLYALEGNSKIFYKYDINTNSWSTLPGTSDNVNEGGAVQYLKVGSTEYVFALLGNSNRFRRYTVGGTWANMANTPASVKKGGALTTDGTNLYAFQGDRKPGFWRYNVGANTWTTLTNAPANVGWGGSLTRIGNYIYAFRGDGKPDFWRYDITANSWSVMAKAPGNVADGGSLTTDGTYVYALQGKTKTFWRYNPATNTWATLASVNFTDSVGQGGALVYEPGSTPIGLFTTMTAVPSLVSTGNQITVKLTLESSTAVSNVAASTLTVTPTGGASCSAITGPTLLSANDDIVDINDPVVYQWICTVAAGTSPGSLTFSASGTGDGPTSFPTAQSRSVLVSPALTFQATVNAGAPIVIENAAVMAEIGGGFGTISSNTTGTATDGSIGDYVWADLDADGVQDGTEYGLAGVKVYVDSNNNGQWDAGEPYDVTDAAGLYRIYGLGAGTYTVRADPTTYPAGYLPTTASSLSVPLTAGQQYDAADFGLATGTGSIGDTVWLDANSNGALDGAEQGLPGITVELYDDVNGNGSLDAGDVLLAADVTDANGAYLFEGLPPGNYLAVVDETSTVTSPYDGNSYTLAGAMDPVFGTNVTSVTLSAGQAYLNADFPYNWGGSIGDYVWYDDNRNQVDDESPATPIEGATVLLYHDADNDGILDPEEYTPVAFMDTDASGQYLFQSLPPGNYLVDVYEDSITTDGNRDVVPTTPDVRVVALGPNQAYLDADFGYYEGAWVRGNVFHDDDRNELFDPSENGLAGITVTLTGTDKNGNPVSETTTTDANGHFIIIVPEGDYTLTYNTTQTTAAGYPDATTVTSFDFHAYPGEDWHPIFDFGVDYAGEVGDRVWNDANGDGNQDTGEPGLAGVTVNLYASDGVTWLAATVTDANGNYLFQGVPDGAYVVKVNPATVPAGFGQTYDNFGSQSDNTGQATVSGGGADLTADFGYRYVAGGGAALYTISGRVYSDANNNGNDDGEPGFANVDVTVACGAFGTFVVQTDSTGAWALAGIPENTVCTVLDADETDLPRTDYVATETPGTPITVTGNLSGLDFGYNQRPGSISGTVCLGDGDGQCVIGEPGISNVPVTLTWFGPDGILGTTDDQVFNTTTDANGDYSFGDLEPGLYQIVETNLTGYTSLADVDGGNPDIISPVLLPLGGTVTDRDFEDTRLGDVTVTKTLLAPLPGPATISDTVKFEIVVKNTGQSLLTTVPLWDYYSPACLENPVVTPGITAYIDNLQPSWTAIGGGGVFSAYIGPPSYGYVSPGATALYSGREAGIIRAGYVTATPWDEGLFAFRPTVTIDAFAAGPVTYDVVNQAGVNPVWMTIEIDTGVVGDRSDNTTYQHVPTTNPAGWHTVDAAAGLWQKWNDNQGDVTGNPLISLSAVAAAHPGLDVVRAYLRLGQGLSYYNGGTNTVAWVDKATLGGVTYDFVVAGGTAGTGTNPALGVLHWPNLGPLAPGEEHVVTVEYHANITDAMYWKEGGWEDYAAKGMPDFDQKQDQWFDPVTGKWFFCGPVAAANSLWWFDSKFEPNPVPPPVVNDGYPLVESYAVSPDEWDDHDPRNVQPFVTNLAALMLTNPAQGTNVVNMANGIQTYLTQKGLINDYTITVLPRPEFEWVESEVRRSEDVVLLLGFWQELPPDSGNWERVGGHYVTVAGVDSLNKKIAFSDPYRDAAEEGGLGRILPNPHPYLHPLQPPDEVHNNAKYLSHDVYAAFTPSPSPGGIWGPAGYAETCGDIESFAGQNAGDLPNGGTCQPAFPIFTEVEYAVAVSPTLTPTVTCDPTTNIAVVSGAEDEFGLMLPEAQAHAQVRIVEQPGIGVAKRVVTPVVNHGDGAYTVEYSIVVQNVGNTVLNSVQVTDSLAATFTGAVSWNVVAGSISATGGLTANTNFNGNTDKNLLIGTDSLASLAQGTITFKVKVTPGSKLGTYNNTAVGSGVSPLGAMVTDDSTDGVDTDPDTTGTTPADNPQPGDDNIPTPVSFTEAPAIGLAKAVDSVVNNGNGTYLVTFLLTVENFGDVVLNNLVITDDIVTQFAGLSPTGFAAANGTLTASGTWNGTAGSNILQAGQSLAVGATGTVKISFTVTPGFPRTVNNTAYTQGTSPAGANVTDQSTVGTDPDNDGGDPGNDNNNNPGDNSTPTPVTFAENPVIGVAKAVNGAVENLGGGQYRVTYLITVRNYGDVALSNIQVTDNLATTFTGATSWSVESVTSADFTVSGSYTGSTPNTGLLVGTDSLAVGASGTITLKVLVTPGANLGPYNNRAIAAGDSPAGTPVTDQSQNGTNPDPDGDNNPGNNSDLTPVSFTAITRIGVAKEVVLPVVNNGDGTYDVTYAIVVKNMGDTQLLGVQVTDNLNTTFGAGKHAVQSLTSATFTVNWPGYNGDTNLNLLAGTDTLNPGQSGTITLVVRVTPGTNLGPYNNTARGTGTSPGGVPAADNSQNGADPDPDGDGDPTNNNIPTPVSFTEAPAIGVAKRVMPPVVNNGDGAYTVEYSVLVQNVGNVVLHNVQVTDDLAATFAGATSWSVVAGSLSATGGLTVNSGFNGSTDKNLLTTTPANSLAKHAEGTITFKVKVTPGSNLGPYNNSATGSGVSPAGTTVTDVSQDGLDTDPDTGGTTPADNPNPGDDSDPTPVRFTEAPQIGLAKALKSSHNNGDGTFTVAYTLTVVNYGDVELRNLQVTDDLSATFSGASNFSVASVTSPAFSVNAGYTGSLPNINLLAGTDTLAVGAQGTIILTVVVTPGTNPGPYNNLATATAVSPAGTQVQDVSQNGLNPDPDGDGNPTNNTAETPVQFPERPVIGIAKTVSSVVNNGNGTHTVTYLLTVENLGDVNLSNVQVTDNLAVTFAPPATFVVNSLTSPAGHFTVNGSYNGGAVTQMLAAGNTLAVGAIKTLTVVVTVTPGTSAGPYNNSARADGVSPIGAFTYDISDNGVDPDPNGNGDPLDPDENDPTPVLFERPAIGAAKVVVGAPINNGDGTYDVTYSLVVENLGDVALTNVQLTDNLNTTFGPGKFVVQSKSATGLTVNGGYNGDTDVALLAASQTLNVGASATITLVVRVTPGSNLGPYNNQANASGTASGVTVTDPSDNGTNPDPDNDNNANEAGENDPTPVSFTENPVIGVAKRLVSSTNNGDGTFTVQYTIVVQNVGDVVLKNVQVTDDLALTFAGATSFSVVPGSLSATGLTANTGFNGTSNKNLLAGTDSLAALAEGAITFSVLVRPATSPATYNNLATGSGRSPADVLVTDVSTDGSDTDPDTGGTTPADNPNPGDDSVPTPVTVTQTPGIAIVKAGPAVSYAGATAVYTYTVTNTGNVRLGTVTVTDDVCGNATYVSGDTNGDTYLDLNETWLFTCSYVVQANDPDPLINIATARGVDPLGRPVSNTDDWTTDLVQFRIGDTVWVDVDNSGTPDPGEQGLYNVPVTITGTDIDNNPVNITAYTDINGKYLVPLAKPGSYTVTTPLTFNGFQLTSPGPSGYNITLTTAAPQNLDADFGYKPPTSVTVFNFGSAVADEGVTLWWEVFVPQGALAPSFDVYRAQQGETTWTKLTADEPVSPVTLGDDILDYTFTDISVQPGTTYLYKLVNPEDPEETYGPYTVVVSDKTKRVFLPLLLR